MHQMIEQVLPATLPDDVSGLAPPAWVTSWVGRHATTMTTAPSVNLTLRAGTTATLVTAIAPAARQLGADAFQRLVQGVYDRIAIALRQSDHQHIVRMWNHVPGIGEAMGDDVDRYMVFNAGRHAAMTNWFGAALARQTPAASGVGHEGDAFVVHALATASGGEPVENPAQVSAYRYSKRYGPMPPCFARATRTLAPRQALMISGTAAITGEESRYIGQPHRQFDLAVDHLRTLVWRVMPAVVEPLAHLAHVRVYVPRAAGLATVEALAHATFTRDVQIMPAELCRPDLLVEIEAYADLEEPNE
jgi:hypothetical protein